MSGACARAWGLGCVVALIVASWPGQASGAPFELSWSAPDGCPSRDEIIRATQARLGAAWSEAQAELFVTGTVVSEAGDFVVALKLDDATGQAVGEREVRAEGQSCTAIEGPTSLVLAMMIAVARPRIEARTAAEEVPPVGDRRPPPAPPVPAALAPPASRSARFWTFAGGVTSVGILPNPGLGGALRAVYSPGWSVVGAAEASFESSASVRAAGGETSFQLLGMSIRAGVSILRTAGFELIPTIGARGVLIRALPAGFAVGRDETRPSMLAGAGGLVRIKLGHSLSVEALPEVEALLFRQRFKVRDGDKLDLVHRPNLVDARLSIGIAYEFQ